MAGMTNLPCNRMLTRFMTSRRRPMTLLLTFLGFWLLLYVFYFGNLGSTSSAKDSETAAVVQMAVPQPVHVDSPISADDSAKANNTNIIDPPLESADTAVEKEKEFAARRDHYEMLCKSGFSGPVGEIYYYEPSKLALCLVPKVGCTFWKRVFHFLYNETGSTGLTSPFQISRHFIHFGGRKKTKVSGYRSAQEKAFIDGFNKVLFTRDPWARIWSSYVDKFVLPDSWLDHGRSIVSRRKDRSQRGRCADDIQFVEFLDYVLNTNRDVHWRPVHKVCNPCAFQPQYVGQMETFSADSSHIMHKVGLEHLLQGHDTQANYAEDEVRMLTDYHFRLYEERPGLRACLKHSGLAGRLWKAFVLNGYIAKDIEFPEDEFSHALDFVGSTTLARDKAAGLLVKYHKSSPVMTSRQMKDYRRSIMAKHYREAPRRLLDKMVDVFSGDFVLFGYETRPADIFVPFPEALQ